MSEPVSVLRPGRAERAFGAGGGEPYERALRRGGGRVALHGHPAGSRQIAVGRFTGAADSTERGLLARLRGPVLDVGCGPGRMLAAALQQGLPALGVDPSRAATELAARAGLPVLRRSVFDPLPGEGRWGTVLLLDGNIGIGGAPAVLLARCAALIDPGGAVVVEVDPLPRSPAPFTAVLVDEDGLRSAAFAWAELGAEGLADVAGRIGLAVTARRTRAGRDFVTLSAA